MRGSNPFFIMLSMTSIEGFIKEELDPGLRVACSFLLCLQKMYSNHSFMKKPGAQLSFLEGEVTNPKTLRGLLPAKDLYLNRLHPKAVKWSKDGNPDLFLFWKLNASDLPKLYKLALCYATTGSYNVGAFSANDNILDDNLSMKAIKSFHFLN